MKLVITIIWVAALAIKGYKHIMRDEGPKPVSEPDYWDYNRLRRYMDAYVDYSKREWFRIMMAGDIRTTNEFLSTTVYGKPVNFDEAGRRKLVEHMQWYMDNPLAE